METQCTPKKKNTNNNSDNESNLLSACGFLCLCAVLLIFNSLSCTLCSYCLIYITRKLCDDVFICIFFFLWIVEPRAIEGQVVEIATCLVFQTLAVSARSHYLLPQVVTDLRSCQFFFPNYLSFLLFH